LLVVALSAVGAFWSLGDAFGEAIEHGRGNILSIDLNRSTVDLRDPKNRVVTWRFRSDATVKFTDGAPFFPTPSVRDLRPPMYVHFTSLSQVIGSFDVVELGFQPGNPDSGSTSHKQQGVSRTVIGRVASYDPSVRQVAIEHNGQTEAFQLTDRTDQRLAPGARVELRTDWSGQRELVSELRVVNDAVQDERASSSTDDRAHRRGQQAYGKEEAHSKEGASSGSNAEGRVVRISSRGVVMDIAGTRETFAVASSRLSRRLRVGETVRFDWETRDGRLVMTNIR
jgi:hypothetical protein